MRRLESRLARLEVRAPRLGREQPRAVYPTTPERTAAVAQILVGAGALRITADGAVLMRTTAGTGAARSWRTSPRGSSPRWSRRRP